MNGNVHFKFRLAGLVIGVRCCFETTRQRCADFLVPDGEPVQAEIAIGPKDIDAERAFLSGKKNGAPLEASSPEALELLVLCRSAAELLPRYDTVLFHGSALSMDGEGVLFTAASGTGKSTHTALWRRVFGSRVRMINDDKPFLSAREGQIRVFGSPWQGKHRLGENTSAPLKAVCILCRGRENTITRVSAAEALPLLMQQTYRPGTSEATLATMRLVCRLAGQTAIYRLCCNMDPEAALVAWRGITSTEENTEHETER